METVGRRASERVELEIPIEVIGLDYLGNQFFDRTRTLVIGRNGGKLCLKQKLVPQQEVTIRCLATGLDADARVVGQVGKSEEFYYYGIKFLDEEDNFWGVEFPSLPDSEAATGRVLLQCTGCKNREVTYLDEFELEVLEANGSLSHFCKRCRDASFWQKCQGETPGSPGATSGPTLPAERPNSRREPRREMHITACVRAARFGQDFVKTRNVSRCGLCFASRCNYVTGEEMEVAVPYSPGGGNIFLRARVVWAQFQVFEGTGIYGIAYQNLRG